MSNNPTKRNGVTPNNIPNIEEDFDFDIHFDKPIDPEHLEGAEELHDFQIDHPIEGPQNEAEHEDFNFNSEIVN